MVIYVFGAGGQGAWAFEVARSRGFSPVFVERHQEAELFANSKFQNAHVAIGDNFTRQKVTERIRGIRPDVNFPRLVHPHAILAESATVDEGCLVLAGATIGPHSHVGEGSSIWSGAILEHHSSTGRFVSLAPGATTGGTVKLGDRVFLGLGAIVKHQIDIGSDVVIGCGAVVLKSIAGPCVAVGSPARRIRTRNPEDAYL